MPGKLKKKALQILDSYCAGIAQQFRQFCREHDRTIKEGWREKITPKDPYESLRNNWAIEALLDRVYQKREKGETDINILPIFSILHHCIQEGGEFLVPADFHPGLPKDPGKFKPGMQTDPNQGQPDDTSTIDEDASFTLKYVVDNENKEALPVFTSESEFEKGEPASRIPLSILECLQIALDDEKLTSMVINPYGNCFIMDKETIKGFLDLIQGE